METTLLGYSLPNILHQIRDLLSQKGYIVQTIPTADPVLIAFQPGNWIRKAKELIIELSRVENEITKIDITVIIDPAGINRHHEVLLELSLASTLNNTFKKVKRSSHGI